LKEENPPVEKVQGVEDLDVFKKAHSLTLEIYRLSERFPTEERFGLISQIRRAAASIATNLMEGGYRLGRAEYRHFVGVARGSAGELKYHLLLSKDLGYLSAEEYSRVRQYVDQVVMMLNGLIRSLSSTKE
jgi:four helix bundle protein